MKRSIIFEIIWLTGSFIVAFLLFGFMRSDRALDINMHDTYLIGSGFVPNLSLMYFVFIYFIVIGFCLCLIRALYFSFKVILTDIILLIFAGLVLYFLSGVIYIIHPPVFESPLIDKTSSAPVGGLFYGGSYSSSYLWGSRIIKIFLMFILAFTGFMIGRNWHKSRIA
jgi:hypothetical protein